MAGRGPAPGANPNRKDDDSRRRRNKPSETFDDLPAEGYQGEYPRLPATWSNVVLKKVENGDGDTELVSETVKITYLKATRDWYDTWARSPMAVKFTGVDWMRLRTVAPLMDQYNRRPAKDLAGELRLQESLLGATVMDRARARMRIVETGEAEPQQRPASRFSHLRVVHGDDAVAGA